MGNSRTIKDVIFITPWIMAFTLFTFINGFIYLFLLMWANLIFIYDTITEKLNAQ